MIISLIGYMGSGKSTLAEFISYKQGLKHIDLDDYIVSKEKMPISEIFKNRGELFFRKQEKIYLEEILKNEDNIILSLGGGTPTYYDNIELINKYSHSIYLQSSIKTLVSRLKDEKEKRPLIAHLKEGELEEFIAKHLFERNTFYNQAKTIINTNDKNTDKLAEMILSIIQKN